MAKGVKQAAIDRALKDPKNPNGKNITTDLGDATGTVTTRSMDIRTPAQALKAAKIDTNIWEVYRQVINSWEVTMGARTANSSRPQTYTNFQVKLFLRKYVITPEAICAKLLAEMKKFAPRYPKLPSPRKRKGAHLLEPCLHDLHYGKRCWPEETGSDYDAKLAERAFDNAIDDIIRKTAGYNFDRILLPIGNDFLHVDNAANTTTAGTRQDVDDRATLLFRSAYKMVVRNVDKLQQIGPVDIVIVPGNHSTLSTFHFGTVLEAHYNRCKGVSVDNAAALRKYKRYGKTLIGYVHGGKDDPKTTDLPLIMAQERKEDWAATTFREWHLGHVHKKKQVKYLDLDQERGVTVRVIPSLSGTDAWHYQHGFIGQHRAGEAFVWDKEKGLVATFTTYAED